jgi:tRNA uridine 5-carbamoylmethylation protein Kti12
MNWRFRRLYSRIGLYLAPIVTAVLVATSAIDTHNQVEKMEEIAREIQTAKPTTIAPSFINDEEARHAAEEMLKAQIEATERYEELNRKLRQFLEELQKMRSQPKQSFLDESKCLRNLCDELQQFFKV